MVLVMMLLVEIYELNISWVLWSVKMLTKTHLCLKQEVWNLTYFYELVQIGLNK